MAKVKEALLILCMPVSDVLIPCYTDLTSEILQSPKSISVATICCCLMQ